MPGVRQSLLECVELATAHAADPQPAGRRVSHLPETFQLRSLLEATLRVDSQHQQHQRIGNGWGGEEFNGNEHQREQFGQLELSEQRWNHPAAVKRASAVELKYLQSQLVAQISFNPKYHKFINFCRLFIKRPRLSGFEVFF